MTDTAPSPRGIPPVRTDWIAEIASRFADQGLEELRTADVERVLVEDVVDGERWRIDAFVFSRPYDAVLEYDGDLWLPTDGERASMRLGVAMTPVFDDEGGRLVRVRLELGPRGAVTFDPENWIFDFPYGGAGDAPRVTPVGIQSGAFELQGLGELPAVPTTLPSAATAGSAHLADVLDIAAGRRSWTTVIGLSHEAPKKRRLFGLGGGRPQPPHTAVTVVAAGELLVEASPQGDASGVQAVTGFHVGLDEVRIDRADGAPIVLRGTDLRVTAHRLLPG
ncbi:MAG: hypothetical protein PGN13_14030 [Patulibacter minatonensis]